MYTYKRDLTDIICDTVIAIQARFDEIADVHTWGNNLIDGVENGLYLITSPITGFLDTLTDKISDISTRQ